MWNEGGGQTEEQGARRRSQQRAGTAATTASDTGGVPWERGGGGEANDRGGGFTGDTPLSDSPTARSVWVSSSRAQVIATRSGGVANVVRGHVICKGPEDAHPNRCTPQACSWPVALSVSWWLSRCVLWEDDRRRHS